MSDPGTSYRTRDEVQEDRQTRDPISGFHYRIVGAGLVEVSEEVKKVKADRRDLTGGAHLRYVLGES